MDPVSGLASELLVFPAVMESRASITTDIDGWFKAVSPAFLELIARPVEALAGVNLIDLVHPHDAALARHLLAEVSRTGSARRTEGRIFVGGGQWQPMQITALDAIDGRISVELATLAPELEPAAEVASAPAVAATFVAPAIAPAVAPAVASAAVAAPAMPTAAPPASPEPAAESAPAPETSPVSEPSPFESVEAVRSVLTITGAQSFPAPTTSAAHAPAGEQVAEQRSAVRASVAQGAPMLEIDPAGAPTFMTGPWHEFGSSDAAGANAFEDLVQASGEGSTVLGLVATAIDQGEPRQVEVHTALGKRWIHVLPIPSPHVDNQLHALVAVQTHPSPGEQVDAPQLADSGAPNPTPAMAAASAVPLVPEAPLPTAAVATLPETDTTSEAGTDSVAAAEHVVGADEDKKGFGFFGWLLVAIAAVIVIVLISKLWPSADDTPASGPVDIEIVTAEPVEIEPGITWRPIGVGALGETHGIAAYSDGAWVAGTNGTIVKLDADGVGEQAVSIGATELTFVSDIAVDESGTAWVLDAGQGGLYQITNGETVRQIPTDANPLRNARGLGLSADGMAWIASTAGAQLSKITAEGAVAELIMLPGRQPSDVVDVGDGTVWFVDAQEIELVHLTIEGEVLSTLPIDSFTSNQGPHLTIDDGSLWVTEPEMSAVFEVDLASGEPTGERVVLTRPADVRVNKPIGISADGDGRLWVIDSTGGATIILEN